MQRQVLATTKGFAVFETPWFWAGAWLLMMIAGAVWVFHPAPAYVAPPGWTYWQEAGPVLDLLLDGEDILVAGRNGMARLRNGSNVEPLVLSGFETPPVTYAIRKDGLGQIWVGHETGFSIRTAAGWINVGRLDGAELSQVRAIEFGQKGEVWIGGSGALWKLDKPSNLLPENSPVEARRMLDGFRVLSLLADSSGGLWAGTDDGLFHFSAGGDGVRSWNVEDGLPNRQVAAMMQDREGRVWVGTGFHDHGGTVVFARRGTDWIIEREIASENMAAPKTRSFFQDGRGNIWLGTETDGFSVMTGNLRSARITKGDLLPSAEVTAIRQTQDGKIWLGTLNGLLSLSRDAVESGVLPRQ